MNSTHQDWGAETPTVNKNHLNIAMAIAFAWILVCFCGALLDRKSHFEAGTRRKERSVVSPDDIELMQFGGNSQPPGAEDKGDENDENGQDTNPDEEIQMEDLESIDEGGDFDSTSGKSLS